MGPIGLQDDPHLTMSSAERIAARKARKEKFFPRNVEAEIRVAQIMETPLTRTPPTEPIKVETPRQSPCEWVQRQKEIWFSIEGEIEGNKLSVRDIQVAVCKEFKISLLDLLSSRRTRDIVRPRQVGYYLAKKITGRSLPDLAARFGGRDHTTALSGIRKVEQLIEADPKFAAQVESLKQRLSA